MPFSGLILSWNRCIYAYSPHLLRYFWRVPVTKINFAHTVADRSELSAPCPRLTWLVDTGDAAGHLASCVPSDSTRARFHTAHWPGHRVIVLLSHLQLPLLMILWVTGVMLLQRSHCSSTRCDTAWALCGHPFRPPVTSPLPWYHRRIRSPLLSWLLAWDAGAPCGPLSGCKVPHEIFINKM